MDPNDLLLAALHAFSEMEASDCPADVSAARENAVTALEGLVDHLRYGGPAPTVVSTSDYRQHKASDVGPFLTEKISRFEVTG